MEKWEYLSTKFQAEGSFGGILDVENFDLELNSLGNQGWELVSIVSTNAAYGKTREIIAVLKRKK
ncbi:protein of unknown function [Clostridium cavendishii DSM 21758]|uniref:DUF4177 domain-containing protein n=1 Tax=Clostridium cavendishii DSM 21758 TaxID=1121302 RepID=A0A1M6UVF2_9CLOT|nr:DUF4177 domain-containing protein [Clostridium cavendishii]SHK73174.1 protein of unknown function [Clostridium cavendishii DSM 21758]